MCESLHFMFCMHLKKDKITFKNNLSVSGRHA